MTPIKFIQCSNAFAHAYIRGKTAAGEPLSHPGLKTVLYPVAGQKITPEAKEEIAKLYSVDWSRELSEDQLKELNRKSTPDHPGPIMATVFEVTPSVSKATPPASPPQSGGDNTPSWDAVPYKKLQELAQQHGHTKVVGTSGADLIAFLIEKQVAVPAEHA